jgi:hypothetical protein
VLLLLPLQQAKHSGLLQLQQCRSGPNAGEAGLQ